MGATHQHAGARQYSLNRLFAHTVALALVSVVTWGVVVAQETAPIAPSSSPSALGPQGRATRELAGDPSGENAIDVETAWHLPPDEGMRGPGGPLTPLYDNGPPLDDGGDPASQASLQIDGATQIWRFHAAAAENFVLPESATAPGSGYQVGMIRVAFDFFMSGAASASPAATWTNGVYVTVYAHSPLNQPAGAPALSGGNIVFTGNVVASTLVPNGALTNQLEVNTGCRIVHQIDIPVNFLLAAETTYWLSVMPRHPGPPQSAWCLTSGTTGIAFPAHRGMTPQTSFWQVIEGHSASGNCSTGGTIGAIKELSFQIFASEISQDLGACCNTATGQCANVDRVANPTACMLADEVFHPGTSCDLLSPACDEGACCYVNQFNQDSCIVTTQAGCDSLNSHSFQLGLACTPDVDCTRPPTNDDCAVALAIPGNNIVVPFNTVNATLDPTTPAPTGCPQIEKDVWFNYTSVCTGTLVVTTIESEFDTVIAVYNGPTSACPPCPTTNDNFVACNDDNIFDPGSDYSLLAIPITTGDCVKIRVGGNPDGGDGVLRVFCIPEGQGACCHADGTGCTQELEANCAPPNRWLGGEPCNSPNACLPNDSCPSPLPLQSVSPLTRAFDTSRATRSPDGQPTDCGSIEQDIWFSYVAPCTGEIEITTDGSAYETLITVYNFSGGTGCSDPTLCAALEANEIACNADQPGGDPFARVRIPSVTAGNCLVIRVGGVDNGFGLSGGAGVLNIFCIRPNEGACCLEVDSTCEMREDVNCLAPNQFFLGEICDADACPTTPPNDLCADAIPLTDPVAEPFDTTNATTDADAAQTECGAIVQDVWYTYVVPCTGTVVIDTAGSTYDTSLAVYGQSGVCPAVCPPSAPAGNSSEAVCSDDVSAVDLTSLVVLQVNANDCLLIRVGGKDLAPLSNGGAGVLNITCSNQLLGSCCHADRTCSEAVSEIDCLALGDQFFPFSQCSDENCPPFPPNDECAGAILIVDGDTPIDTTTASDSSQVLTPTPTCAQPTKDLWYKYEASCNGAARLSLCAVATFDTTMAAYADCNDCSDDAVLIACDNNGCGPSGRSEIFMPVTLGVCYLIRIGGVEGGSGTAVLNVTCGPNPICCPGDVNRDNVVDIDDVAEFVAIVLEPVIPQDPSYCAANLNGDDSIDARDIQLFVDVLVGGLPCESLLQGACCLGAACSVEAVTDCAALGGDYQGHLTDCESTPCSVVTSGACCLPGDVCLIRTPANCASGNGSYQGDGTTCLPNNPCISIPEVTCDDTSVTEMEASDPGVGAFGESVRLSGTAVVVGAATKDANTGAAYVLRNTAGVWAQEQKLTASDATFNEHFGDSVAIDGDRIMVGAPRSGLTDVGAVYEFEGVAGVWTQGQKLQPLTPQPGRQFGNAVALEGDMAIIGALQDNEEGSFAGAAFVYKYDGVDWVPLQKLTASDASAGDRFGASVVIRGNLAAIGAPFANFGAISPGAVYMFLRTGDTWAEVAKLTASDPATGSQFGSSADIGDGRVVIGAHLASDNGVQSGAAYVFDPIGGVWQQSQKLLPSDPGAQGYFGTSVRMIDDAVAIGSQRKDAVYVFTRLGGQWQEENKLTSPTAVAGDQLGVSLDWDGTTLVVGASLGEVTTPASDTGAVHFFEFACNGACCVNGSCQMQLAEDCTTLGGTFGGVGVLCGPLSCPDPGACCIGDFSGNGICDLADVGAYVDAVLAAASTPPALCLADADENGTVDGQDIAMFVEKLLAAVPCP